MKSLPVLREEWKNCTRCGLSTTRGNRPIVFGTGNRQAELLFIYDAPTSSDVDEAIPMTGQEGEIFLHLLEDAEVDVKSIYVTSIVGCRPTVLLPATSDTEERIADRSAKADEIEACNERLSAILYAIDPRVVFAMGDVAWKALIKAKDRGTTNTLDKAVGEIFHTKIRGLIAPDLTYPVIPILDMKKLIMSPSVAEHGPLRTTIGHLKRGRLLVEYIKELEARDTKDATGSK